MNGGAGVRLRAPASLTLCAARAGSASVRGLPSSARPFFSSAGVALRATLGGGVLLPCRVRGVRRSGVRCAIRRVRLALRRLFVATEELRRVIALPAVLLPIFMRSVCITVCRLMHEILDMIGFGGRHVLDLLQSLFGMPAHLLDLVAYFLGDADRLLFGKAAELTLHFDDRLARLTRRVQHLFSAHAENAPRTIVADAEELGTVGNAEHGRRARLCSPQVARGFHLKVPQKRCSSHGDFRHALQMLRARCLLALLPLLRALLRLLAVLLAVLLSLLITGLALLLVA
jgi:hypothetical protein